jgi:hypothetical protein
MVALPSALDRSRRRWRRVPARTAVLIGLALPAAACSSGSGTPASTSTSPTTTGPTASGAAALRSIHHVFLIVLENQGYDATFGSPASDPYLASTLPAQGALLTDYYGIGHLSNDNYIALVSGQAPNPLNQADCQTFVDFPSTAAVAADGQISGSGCVFPTSVQTVADQLDRANRTWKGYMEDMGNVPSREASVCAHPPVGAPDPTQRAVAGDGYATRHDPFVYFHSIIDDTRLCDSHVVPLGSSTGSLPAGTPAGATPLATDLKSVSTTPNLSVIVPNLCNDGHDAPCINQAGGGSALTNIDAFLRTWVPLITGSPAYKQDGLLEVTFDEAEVGGDSQTSAASCCNQVPGPASPNPGLSGPGGGRIGSVLLSPFIAAGTKSAVPYNHYATLGTIEDIFGLSRLGQAKTVSAVFGKDVFTGG